MNTSETELPKNMNEIMFQALMAHEARIALLETGMAILLQTVEASGLKIDMEEFAKVLRAKTTGE